MIENGFKYSEKFESQIYKNNVKLALRQIIVSTNE